MKRIHQLSEVTAEHRGGALTIGNFDGVHRGHAKLIERLIANAHAVGGPAVVFTFAPHPAEILRPGAAPTALSTDASKCELFANLGVDVVVTYPTDRKLLSLSPDAFFSEIIESAMAAKAIVEGPNFHFGANRAGNVEKLRELCRARAMELEIVQPVDFGPQFIISSSRIRTAIQKGNVRATREMLARPYRIAGTVAKGAQRGRQLGFPTANLEQIATLLPPLGVYAGRAMIGEQSWPAAIHIGPNPTFDDDRSKVEVHLVGFDGNLYDKLLEVDFLRRLRDIQRFDSVDQLTGQLKLDVANAVQVGRRDAENATYR